MKALAIVMLLCGPAAAAPCFPATTKPLVAAEIVKRLSKYMGSMYEGESDPAVKPPSTTFGSCKVVRNAITDRDGSLVAELGCGMRVVKRGIVDGRGVQVGSLGKDVLAKKTGEVRCVSNGPGQVRCHVAVSASPTSVDADGDAYVVAGDLGDEEVVTGAAARAFLAPRRLVELHVNFWCH
ncbi:MAG: hypothetical protein ABI867_20450 [Kofleriaceae bacterium]